MFTINGTIGNDTLIGTAAGDLINGLGGIDTITAGDGDDRIIVWDHPPLGNPTYGAIDGGAGHDILDFTGWQGPLEMTAYATTEMAVGSTTEFGKVFTAVAQVRNVEEIWLPQGGGSFAESLVGVTISGPFTAWKVVGGSGSDGVYDGRGSDTISTGAGDDGVTFHGGNDQVSLGDGNDNYRAEDLTFFSGNPTIDAGSGTDDLRWDPRSVPLAVTIDLQAGQATNGISHMTVSGFENVWVSGLLQYSVPGWRLEISGDGGANQLHGSIVGAGTGLLNGRAGNDSILLEGDVSTSATVYGGSGNDLVVGAEGADWINGGQASNDPYDPAGPSGGSDTLYGGGGNDHIYGNAQFAVAGSPDGDDSIGGGDGADYINGNAGNDTIAGDAGSDRLYGGAGNDLIYGDMIGNFPADNVHGNDHLNGNKGNDTLYGGAGNDDLRGGQNEDELHGGDGTDTLGGDAGDDLLDGGAGQDLLTGGLGRDIFEFDTADAHFGDLGSGQVETITDFTHGSDQIWLAFHPALLRDAGLVADLVAAKVAADALVSTSAGSTIIEAEVGHDLYLMFAGTGSGQIDSAIRLENVGANILSVADFV